MTNFNSSEPIHGFTTVLVEPVPDYNGDARLMRHEPTGAELLFLANDDAEKAFAIGFKTPPTDDTGVFHIIEHSTLCGSRKYPVKDPFVHLLKTSMNTFLNAATGQTHTYYPVASTNEKDLFNLADVYLDAVFHPALLEDEAIFLQEGWHYEVEGDEVATTGVVLNEMRGYASPESDLSNAMKRMIYSGTPYAFISGGEPGTIEQLTYEQFVETYRRCYRPDNCRITVYGDVDVERMLAFLDSHLREAVASREGAAPAGKPADVRDFPLLPVPAANTIVVEGDITPDRCMFQCWSVVSGAGDPDRTIACMMLADQLFSSDEAPVKRRVLATGVCSQMVGMLSPDPFHPTLRVMMLGTQPHSADACREALLDAVREVLNEGLSLELVEAGIAQLEFRLKSHDFGPMPDGIMFILDSMPGWLAFEDRPTGYAQYERYIDFMRSKLGTDYYQKLLEDMFFDNDHVVFGELVPQDAATGGEGEASAESGNASDAPQVNLEVARELAQRAFRLLDARTEAMESAPLEVLPRLTREDLGQPIEPHEPTLRHIDESTYLVHHLHPNGIVYVTRVFDISNLPADEAPYLSLLCDFLSKVSTKSHTAEQLEILMKKTLGKLNMDPAFMESLVQDRPVTVLEVSSSMLSAKVEDAVQLVNEVLYEADLSDLSKLRLSIEQGLQGLRMMFAHGRFALPMLKDYASSRLSAASRLNSMADGVGYYQFLEDLLARADDEQELAELAAHLERLAKEVFGSCPELTSFTGTEEELERYHACDARWADFKTGRPAWGEAVAGGQAAAPYERLCDVTALPPADSALVLPVEVACNFATTQVERPNAAESGVWILASELLSLNHLWLEVREKGGAYGSRMKTNLSGIVMLFSHDDPRIDATFATFAEAATWLERLPVSDEDFEGAVISSVATLDKPNRVSSRALAQLSRFLNGAPYDANRQARQALLACTRDDISACGSKLGQAYERVVRTTSASPMQLQGSNLDFETIDLLHIMAAEE